jgi:phospholipase C
MLRLLFVGLLPVLHSLPSPIKHIIVLMEENRSFDHMLGYAKKLLGVNGLDGTECNLVNTSDPKGGKKCVDDQSPYIAKSDPDHGTPATTNKIFGKRAVSEHDFKNPDMSGFVEWNLNCDVMSMFAPEKLPVMVALAQEFAVMDRFFAGHPGPTWPNRLFALSATSAGLTETGHYYQDKVTSLFPQKTIFDQVEEANLDWRVYYNDTPWEVFLEKIAHSAHNLRSLDEFFQDAAKGTLPSFAWINPLSGMNFTSGVGSNDHHPDHDVAAGEAYYKSIYEALRASPQWNETLFIITYDEHGGFYDHVSTPLNVPAPDGSTSYPDMGFEWNRLGVRLPTFLISPWIKKGTVISGPPEAQKPFNNSEYDITSIIATTRKILGLGSTPLTKRDGWVATFEQALSLDSPRTDCPLHLPPAPPPTLSLEDEARLPLNDLQQHLISTHALVNGIPLPTHLVEQSQVGAWLQDQFLAHKDRTLAWRQSKKEVAALRVAVQSSAVPHFFVENQWEITRNASLAYDIISTKTLVSGKTPYCLDANGGVNVTVSLCYPSAEPSFNRDIDQQWRFHRNGSTIRWFGNVSRCLTTHKLEDSTEVSMDTCDDRVEQSFAWLGKAPGDDSPSNQIQFGAYALGITNVSLT